MWLHAFLVFITAMIGGGIPVSAEDRVVTVGVYENAPKVFTDDSGRPAGIFIDIIEYIAKEEGWTLRYVHGAWGEGLSRLERGEIDLMPDIANSAERMAQFTLHEEPVLSDWFQVYTRNDSTIESIVDLAGKRIVVLERSVQEAAFRQLAEDFGIEVTLIPLPDYQTIFERVSVNDADAAVTNRFHGAMYAGTFHMKGTAIVFNPARLFFAAPKGTNELLLRAVDSHLARLKEDRHSMYYQSLERWASPAVTVTLPPWMKFAGMAAGIAFFMSLMGSIILKRQVNFRTRELSSRNEQLQSMYGKIKQTEQELRESEHRYRKLFDTANDAILLMRGDRVIDCNPQTLVMFGCSRAEILGTALDAFSPHPDPDRRCSGGDAGGVRALTMTEDARFCEWEQYRRDGTTFMSEVSLNSLELDGEELVQIIVRDITRRKQTEELLVESERKYRELIELANSIILRWNSDGIIIFLNEYGVRYFGYSPDEIIGRHVVGTIVPYTEQGGRDLYVLMEQICANPGAFEQNVNENMRRNGDRVWIAWTNKVVLNDQGEVHEILSIGTDITGRKRADEQIQKLHEELQRHASELEHRVSERTAELAVAKERAESADQLKSAFLATMSHELRTPLNSIIGFTGILLQNLAGPLNEEQQKQLSMVQNSARHLLSLINDVLDISKIEAGQLSLSFSSFELRPSIEKTIKLVSPIAEQKGIDVLTDIADTVTMVTTDQRRLEQIILNLLTNAVKFTEHGHVLVTCSADTDHYLLSVSDTGIGINPGEISGLFQPFHQIDSGITRKHEGTGLGLSICKKLITMMHGSIEVQSEWGRGSTFTIRFPGQAGDAS